MWKKEFSQLLRVSKKKFRENGGIFAGYKKQPFFVENNNLINMKIKI